MTFRAACHDHSVRMFYHIRGMADILSCMISVTDIDVFSILHCKCLGMKAVFFRSVDVAIHYEVSFFNNPVFDS